MNKFRRKCWVRNAKHYYMIICRQAEQDATYHAERVADEMQATYGTKVKNWPEAKCIVEEDFSYWER